MTFIVNIIIQKIDGVSNFQSQRCWGSITIPQADFCCLSDANSMYIIGALLVTKWASL